MLFFVRAKDKFVVVQILRVRCLDKGEVFIRSGVWSTHTKYSTLLVALVHVTTAGGRVLLLYCVCI